MGLSVARIKRELFPFCCVIMTSVPKTGTSVFTCWHVLRHKKGQGPVGNVCWLRGCRSWPGLAIPLHNRCLCNIAPELLVRRFCVRMQPYCASTFWCVTVAEGSHQRWKRAGWLRWCTECRMLWAVGSFSFTFREFSRRFYKKWLTISTYVRRKRNSNILLSVQEWVNLAIVSTKH